jgi:predicted amino acid dehydrogenase
MTWPTSRRYPRTLREAFPSDFWCAVEHYRRLRFDIIDAIQGAVCIGACVLIGWLLTRGI